MPAELSGGMCKRAGLARALALEPDLLFFDEPSAGLDPLSSAGLDKLILDLRERTGATIVVVTHELDSVFTIGDRALMLDRERRTLVADGKPAELIKEYAGSWVGDFLSRVKNACLMLLDGNDNDLYWSDRGGKNQSRIVTVSHYDTADNSRGNSPRGLVAVFKGIVAVQKLDIKRLRESVAEVV